jgi:hypothetical protein
MTAMRGGVIPLRSSTEQTAWTPGNGAVAYRQDIDARISRVGGAWVVEPLEFVTEGKDGAPPAGAQIIHKYHKVSGVTTAGSLMAFTFPTPFPNSCAMVFFTTASGSASATILNSNTLSASGATAVIPSSPSQSVTFYYHAIGW